MSPGKGRVPFSYLQPLLQSGNHVADGTGRLSPPSSPEVSAESVGTGAREAEAARSLALGLARPSRLQLANGSPPRALPLPPPFPLPAPSSPPGCLSSPPGSAGFAERTASRALATQRGPSSPRPPPALARPGPRPSGASRSGLLAPRTTRRRPRTSSERGKTARGRAMDPVSQVGRTWAGRRELGAPRSGEAPQPLPHALFLSLSGLARPKLASAGTFRALKEPLAFLRALELVSAGCVRGGETGSEPSGEERSGGAPPLAAAAGPEFGPQCSRPPHSEGAAPGWRGRAGATALGVGSVDGLLQALRGVISPPAGTPAGAAVRSLPGRWGGGERSRWRSRGWALGLTCTSAGGGCVYVRGR